MTFTAEVGTRDSYPGNIVPGGVSSVSIIIGGFAPRATAANKAPRGTAFAPTPMAIAIATGGSITEGYIAPDGYSGLLGDDGGFPENLVPGWDYA